MRAIGKPLLRPVAVLTTVPSGLRVMTSEKTHEVFALVAVKIDLVGEAGDIALDRHLGLADDTSRVPS